METLPGVLDRVYGNIARCLGQVVWKHWQVSWAGCMETLADVLGTGRLFGNIGMCCLGHWQAVWKHWHVVSWALAGCLETLARGVLGTGRLFGNIGMRCLGHCQAVWKHWHVVSWALAGCLETLACGVLGRLNGNVTSVAPGTCGSEYHLCNLQSTRCCL
jgi:hypothetical protein